MGSMSERSGEDRGGEMSGDLSNEIQAQPTLGQLQRRFVRLIADLIVWTYSQPGHELTFSETYRTPEQAKWNSAHGTGIQHSLHIDRLAADLNLFIDGEYRTDVESYRSMGEYWKSLDPLCCWGGDFSRPDADHFSMTYGGRK